MNLAAQIIVAVIGSAGLLGVGWLTYKSTRKGDKITAEVAKETNAITWSQTLVQRLETVEKTVKEQKEKLEEQGERLNLLSRVFSVSVRYIESILLWVRGGSVGDMPAIPESLKEHLDPSLIREHRQEAGKEH